MKPYEDLIVDLMLGNTLKEKYEYAKQMHSKIEVLQGHINFLKSLFEIAKTKT
jgi:hypothetical protein